MGRNFRFYINITNYSKKRIKGFSLLLYDINVSLLFFHVLKKNILDYIIIIVYNHIKSNSRLTF